MVGSVSHKSIYTHVPDSTVTLSASVSAAATAGRPGRLRFLVWRVPCPAHCNRKGVGFGRLDQHLKGFGLIDTDPPKSNPHARTLKQTVEALNSALSASFGAGGATAIVACGVAMSMLALAAVAVSCYVGSSSSSSQPTACVGVSDDPVLVCWSTDRAVGAAGPSGAGADLYMDRSGCAGVRSADIAIRAGAGVDGFQISAVSGAVRWRQRARRRYEIDREGAEKQI